MPRKKKVTVINEHGDEIEEEQSDDDESIVDPISRSNSRCGTPSAALSPLSSDHVMDAFGRRSQELQLPAVEE